MSTPPQPEPLLAITNCDSFEGQIIAIHLIKHLDSSCLPVKNSSEKHNTTTSDKQPGKQSNDKHSDKLRNKPTQQIVCLARDQSKCQKLKEYDIVKLVQISHDNPDSISVALRGLQTVILVPEMDEKQVDWVNQWVDIMAKEMVIRCILVSAIGTDAPEKEHLIRYRRMEEKVEKTMQRWTILRQGFLYQCLYYWIPMVQNQNTLGMPIGPEHEFTPLHIGDLGDAVVSVTFPNDHSHDGDDNDENNNDHDDNVIDSNTGTDTDADTDTDDDDDGTNQARENQTKGACVSSTNGGHGDSGRFDSQTYTLTGPQQVTGPKLVDHLNQSLDDHPEDDKDHRRHPLITYKVVTRDECKNYLLTLRDRQDKQAHHPALQMKESDGYLATLMRRLARALGRLGLQDSKSSFTPAHAPIHDVTGKEDTVEVVDEDGDTDRLIDVLDCQDPPRDSKDPSSASSSSSSKGNHRVEPPNDTEIELMLDLMDYINEGKATFQSGDMEKITGKQGMGPEKFFEKNGDRFREGPKDDAPANATTTTTTTATRPCALSEEDAPYL
ncbi:hypothetical protein BG004_000829 [Podila humilis]|nr:hypothetical protein BG004_000829 [Podila humilis]